jgi:hypothetical protein
VSGFGAPGTWSFPGGNTYRIQAAPTPNLGSLGPGRAASYRGDLSYTTFFVQADVVNWNNAVPQSFGLAARLSQVGLGTTDGYLLLYDTSNGDFDIYRVDNEGVTSLAGGTFTLTAGTAYRFTFEGTGGTFTGSVATVATPDTPLLTISNAAPDTTYAGGFSGLLVAENTSGPINGADATFDNYLSAPVNPIPEPSALALAALGLAGVGYRARRRAGAAR